MSIRDDLDVQLAQLAATGSGASTVTVSDAGVSVSVELAAVESLGCQVSRVLVSAPSIGSASVATLQTWADELAKRITYLLESLSPLETDEEAGELLMRSSSPQQLPAGRQYYECVLAGVANGTVSFCRYESTKGQAGRTRVDMILTREVLGRLVFDLVDTMP